MKKQSRSRLSLHRETLQRLADTRLDGVAGGSQMDTEFNTCDSCVCVVESDCFAAC